MSVPSASNRENSPAGSAFRRADVERRVLGELNDLFHRSRRWHLLALHLVTATILALVLRGRADPTALAGMVVAVSAVTAINAAARWRYPRAAAAGIDPRRWEAVFAGCATLTGLAWGLSASLVYWGATGVERMMVPIVLVGLCSNAGTGYAMNRRAARGFLLTALPPFIALCLTLGDLLHLALATLMTFYLVTMLSYSRKVHMAQREALRLRIEREGLIGELRSAQEDMAGAMEQAHRANRAKSEFLATMSHELRTPLNAILGFSELIRDEQLGPAGNPHYAEYAKDIHASGMVLLDMINDVLDLSKIEAGKFELAEETIDLDASIRSALRLVEARAAAQDLRIKTRPDKALPLLRGDPRTVRQMLVNLLSNAVKFTPAGGTIAITAEADGDGLAVTVTDTGIGVAPEDIGRILEPFGQVRAAQHPDRRGTGLGLPLVKSLIERHGGSLAIESAVGSGTRITLRFPADRLRYRSETARIAS